MFEQNRPTCALCSTVILLLHYLGLHQKCELAQLALLNITTFYPSETFILKLWENLVFLPRPVETILVDKLQTSRAEAGCYQLGLSVLQENIELDLPPAASCLVVV